MLERFRPDGRIFPGAPSLNLGFHGPGLNFEHLTRDLRLLYGWRTAGPPLLSCVAELSLTMCFF